MRVSLIIAAGGRGNRFRKHSAKAVSNKIFHPFLGEPLLVKTLKAFQGIKEIREIVAAVPPETRPICKKWKKQYSLPGITWVAGGKTRAESVWNALRKTRTKSDWIMVHDGARPLINEASVRLLLRSASSNGHADGLILAAKVIPTIKRVFSPGNEIEKTVDRETLCEAQTPQLVRKELLLKAYRECPKAFQATDESALLESAGGRVKAVIHDSWNPKITVFEDLKLAEAYLAKNEFPEIHTGFGRDTHRLVTGRKFYLGGVHIPSNRGALGHSDGDVLLHAIADAVLGAIGAGDIGEHFSDRDKRFKNIRSEKILKAVIEKAGSKGWLLSHVDSVIVLEKPRLGAYKEKMRKKIAALLNLNTDQVSVKAKTAEGLGPEGEGLAVTCEAVVTMRKVMK